VVSLEVWVGGEVGRPQWGEDAVKSVREESTTPFVKTRVVDVRSVLGDISYRW